MSKSHSYFRFVSCLVHVIQLAVVQCGAGAWEDGCHRYDAARGCATEERHHGHNPNIAHGPADVPAAHYSGRPPNCSKYSSVSSSDFVHKSK